MENEIWKVYKQNSSKKFSTVIWEVSNYGRVKRNGELYECDKSKTYLTFGWNRVHRAVAELFIPNPNNYKDVDHIDTNKHNNHYTNLRWCNRYMNMQNPNTKNKMLGHEVKETTKDKISNTLKQYFTDPENRKKAGAKNKGRIPWNKGLKSK